MLIVAMKPGHDGAIAAVSDRKLLYLLESEKDSFRRHADLTPMSILEVTERIGDVPDVVAVGGWQKEWTHGWRHIETGYRGAHAVSERETTFCGKKVKMFSSSHTRSHIMMAAGMAPLDEEGRRAVLVWEGADGAFFLLDERWNILEEIPVLDFPGGRYAFLFGLAQETYPDWMNVPPHDDSGKLMALAAFGDSADADEGIRDLIEQLLAPSWYPARVGKGDYRDSPVYNAGVESQELKTAAKLLTERLFDIYARVALERLPAGIPLYISGGCGLNCDWNHMWRELGHFASVFVPPCTNDSGSALGTALDALAATTGDPRVEWNVYSGLEFEWDQSPDAEKWERDSLDYGRLAETLANGTVVAWVQGRYEIGPRALGNRSLLAEPSSAATRDKLNEIKQREDYRPIAPCCRLEDAGKVFDADFHDPYMLYFRMVESPDLAAVTHVDGSARVQTVKQEDNKPLHDLLSAFAERNGVGVLCNTSLNYKGFGFINRMRDLANYCETREISDFVVGDTWFRRVGGD